VNISGRSLPASGKVGKGIALAVCSNLEFAVRKQKTVLLSVLERLVYLKLVDYFLAKTIARKLYKV